MDSHRLQISLTTMLLAVACVALNIWLFRVGVLWGIVGLNVMKHVAIAHLCHVVGLNRAARERTEAGRRAEPSAN